MKEAHNERMHQRQLIADPGAQSTPPPPTLPAEPLNPPRPVAGDHQPLRTLRAGTGSLHPLPGLWHGELGVLIEPHQTKLLYSPGPVCPRLYRKVI